MRHGLGKKGKDTKGACLIRSSFRQLKTDEAAFFAVKEKLEQICGLITKLNATF